MKPNFPLFRKLYARLAAKPEQLINLNQWASEPIDCGTPFCVLGELVEMPEAQAIGWSWTPAWGRGRLYRAPAERGREFDFYYGSQSLGLSEEESCRLFYTRQSRETGTDKQIALKRIEDLFARHGEPLHEAAPIEVREEITQ